MWRDGFTSRGVLLSGNTSCGGGGGRRSGVHYALRLAMRSYKYIYARILFATLNRLASARTYVCSLQKRPFTFVFVRYLLEYVLDAYGFLSHIYANIIQ